eukprot:5090967-Pyramimonas_sp.AAC.1
MPAPWSQITSYPDERKGYVPIPSLNFYSGMPRSLTGSMAGQPILGTHHHSEVDAKKGQTEAALDRSTPAIPRTRSSASHLTWPCFGPSSNMFRS